MKIQQNILTKNECYIKGTKITPSGVMVHSTACKGVMAANFLKSWDTFRPGGKQVCVHAFIDNTGVYQTLPFDVKGWHAGGSANSLGYIGFEICEPKSYEDKQYFEDVKSKAVEFVAYLCYTYFIPVKKVIDHQEGYKQGLASNHGDIKHWWVKYHNYTMDDFRQDVLAEVLKLQDKEKYETEVENMSKEEIEAIIREMGKNEPASAWAADSIEKAKEIGLSDGSNPLAYTTREQTMAIAVRIVEYIMGKNDQK